MSTLEESVPPPFAAALSHLRTVRDPHAKIDAIDSNFAYVWVSNIGKNTSGEQPGGWIRLPLAFPYANPHGLVTREPLKRSDGNNVADAYHGNHGTCNPVHSAGGAHYYSWTWEGAPAIRSAEDIIGVVQWYERRIRNG